MDLAHIKTIIRPNNVASFIILELYSSRFNKIIDLNR